MKNRILQIVQYSDMHLAGDDYVAQRWRLNRVNRLLGKEHQQGLAGADRDALTAFGEFLAQEIVADPDWTDLPLWLVDTGDGTTFGDSAALNEWSQWSIHFRAQAGANAKLMILYGNHDAWPETHPILAPHRMATQRDALRKNWFLYTLNRPGF